MAGLQTMLALRTTPALRTAGPIREAATSLDRPPPHPAVRVHPHRVDHRQMRTATRGRSNPALALVPTCRPDRATPGRATPAKATTAKPTPGTAARGKA